MALRIGRPWYVSKNKKNAQSHNEVVGCLCNPFLKKIAAIKNKFTIFGKETTIPFYGLIGHYSIHCKKTETMARVSIYLNFPRNTEEVFHYYKSIFGGEFSNGIARFSDIPVSEGMPQIAEEDKNLIMHIELPILDGFVLMGTDAPESMGFTVNYGNAIHINLDPETKAETKRLFDALSAGGKITMELQTTFWGAYYGSCTDKYGIQWMFNCTEK